MGGLLTRKCQRDSEPLKDGPMVTSPVAKSQPSHPSLPTSSLELITHSDYVSKSKGKDKASKGSF